MNVFIDGSTRAAVNRMFPVWKDNGIKIVENIKNADIHFCVIFKRIVSNLPTVLRLDGIYYDMGINYDSKNKRISKAHVECNGVVYQSKISMAMCEKYLEQRKTNIFKVIYNGVDPKTFMSRQEHEGINVVSCAKWRRPKRLREIIEVFDKFNKKFPRSKLYIIGPLMHKAIDHPKVLYLDRIELEEIVHKYRIYDIYIHLCKKDSCPSSVIEAIGAGIPVVTTNACGGATEICNLTEGCIVVSGEPESLEPDYIYKNPYNEIPESVKNKLVNSMCLISEKRNTVILPDTLHINHTANEYVKLMKEVINAHTIRN